MTGDNVFAAEALRLCEPKAPTMQIREEVRQASTREELRQVVREEHHVMKEWTAGWCRQLQQHLTEHTQLLKLLVDQQAEPAHMSASPSRLRLGRKGTRHGTRGTPRQQQEQQPQLPQQPQRSQQQPQQPQQPQQQGRKDFGELSSTIQGGWSSISPTTSKKQEDSSPDDTLDLDALEEELVNAMPPDTPKAAFGAKEQVPSPRSKPPSLAQRRASNASVLPMITAPGSRDLEAPVSPKSLPRHCSRTITDASQDSHHQREADRQEWSRHLQMRVSAVLERGGTRMVSNSTKGLSSRLAVHVEGTRFQMACAMIIIANAVFVGYTSDVSMSNVLDSGDPQDPSWFRLVNSLFTAVFAIEVLLRIFALRCSFFCGSEKLWNLFDTILVLSSLSEEVVQDIGLGSLRVIRGLRMLKVLRIIRVMRFFRDLRLMVCSIMQSLGSLSWALLLLLLIMYLFTVFFMQGAIIFLRDESSGTPGNTLVRQGITMWYGTVMETMYTLLAAITGGVSWNEVVRPLEEISELYRLFFCFYIVFVVIGVLNVLTGIFVERACELSGLDRDLVIQSEMKRSQTFLVEMKRIFEEADEDGSGTISYNEFKSYLENDRVKAYLATQQLDAFDARTLFDILNINGDEEISIEKFIVGCQRLRGIARSIDLVAVLQETRSANLRLKTVLRSLERQFHDQVWHLEEQEEDEEDVEERVTKHSSMSSGLTSHSDIGDVFEYPGPARSK